MSPHHILLFGDQSVEKLSGIQALVRNSKTVPQAKRFLEEATDVIQLEFSRLNIQDHGWDKKIDSLLEMAEQNDSEPQSNTVVSTSLMICGRLGQLIVEASEDPTILGGENLEPVDIVALCGGLLPAAAAVAARDTSELFALSKEILSVGFRLAVEVHRRAQLVDSAPLSWGKTYTGLSQDKVEQILQEFHESQNIPQYWHIAIGVSADSWMTLIGPPSSLVRLAAWSPELGAASSLETDVPGPIHSRCLPPMDTSKIVGNSPLLKQPISGSKARMYSPASCKEYKHSTLQALLEEVVEDISHNVLHVTRTIQGCVDRLDDKRHAKLSVMGPTNHLAAMKQALNKRGIQFQMNGQAVASSTTDSKMIRGGSDLIAIVGMAGRFPGSESVEAFWEDLLAGKCQIKEIPKSRFDLDVHFDPTGEKKNSTAAKHGCFLDEPGLFDHRLFNISPREAAQMDPAHRLLLTIGYEALQQAGYTPEGSLSTGSSRIASYFGQAADEWMEVLNQKGADIYYVPGFSRAFGPARLHYQYKWSGPSYALDSACSTSATAVSLACSALITRECDTALAGGASVLTSPNTFSGLSRAGMLSNTGGCRTYHDDADGYCRAEGAGVVVLKRLEDAQLDNDNILAVIRGSARTYSSAASSMTHPSAESQEDTYNQVLRQSCLNTDEIAYVEMHGTGTQAGDVEEMASVSSLSRNRRKDNPLTVGAVKAAVGHGEGASAITSLIKVIMMIRDRQIPPQPGAPFKLNQKFPPLGNLNIKIATKVLPLKPSPKGDKRIKALVNSFDASGGNVSLAIEEPPERATKSIDPRVSHVVALSARSAYSLKQNRIRLLDYLERKPETGLADLAYTTTARRMHEPLRCAYTGSSTADIVRQLRADVQKQGDTAKTTRKSRNQNRIFLFTGQGSQYAGMGADLFRSHDGFRSMLLGYQELATNMGLPGFIDLISDPGVDLSSQSTTKIQLAIVALEIGLAHLLRTWGIVPNAVIGHSLGEYSALCISGVLSVSETLLLVGRRASLMEKKLTANTYAMLATNSTEDALETLFKELKLDSCTIACNNAPSVTVASGLVQEIETLQKHMTSIQGLRTSLLRVPYGFHSGQVDPILEEYQKIAKGLHFSQPQIPIISTLTGKVEQGGSTFCPAYLAQQARQKVKFSQALNACKAAGLAGDGSLWFEIGPEPVCIGLARRTLDLPVTDLIPTLKSGTDNWHTISSTLKRAYESGFAVNWPEVHKPFTGSLTLLDLPTYAFDSRDFWTPYKEPELPMQAIQVGTGVMTAPVNAGPPPIPGFPTSTLHRVEREKTEGSTSTATFSSNVSEANLLSAIKGHGVNGHTICPLGIFHDMALTAASYVLTRLHGNSKAPEMSIQDMEMSHAFVLNAKTLDATFYVTSSYCEKDKVAQIEFTSNSGGTTTAHGKCQVAFTKITPSVWSSNLAQSLFLVKSRVDSLKDLATVGKAHRLAKPVVYQLFNGVVQYAPVYQAMEEVIMDYSSSDAIGTVKLPDTTDLGHFHTDPYWTDAVLHLAGFVLNSGLRYPQEVVCLATGFQTWRSVEKLVPGETYTSYVCMQEHSTGSVISGDCWVFRGNELVQATLGITFLKLKRVALNTILGVASEPQDLHQSAHIQKRESSSGGRDNDSAASAHARITPNLTETLPPPPVTKTGINDLEDKIKAMLSVVASESGATMDDLTDDAKYADLGIDSVMSITIFSMVNRNLGVDLPASFFMENETIGESKAALRSLLELDSYDSTDEGIDVKTPPAMEMSVDLDMDSHRCSEATDSSSSLGSVSDEPAERRLEEQEQNLHAKIEGDTCTLVAPVEPRVLQPPVGLVAHVKHYQGARTTGARNIFFLADESGSTFSYMYLSSLGEQFVVYGVDSPFAGKKLAADIAGLLDLDVPTLASVYRAAIQKQQPSGPYILGGVSSGAVLAYECSRQLIAAGHEVEGLVILDCPGPISRNGVGSSAAKAPKRRLLAKPGQAQHIENTAAIFKDFKPVPMSLGIGMGVQVLAKDPAPVEDDEITWSDLVPVLQTMKSEAPTGLFLSSSNVGAVGKTLAGALEGVRRV